MDAIVLQLDMQPLQLKWCQLSLEHSCYWLIHHFQHSFVLFLVLCLFQILEQMQLDFDNIPANAAAIKTVAMASVLFIVPVIIVNYI